MWIIHLKYSLFVLILGIVPFSGERGEREEHPHPTSISIHASHWHKFCIQHLFEKAEFP
jgi:hypothetical protein